MLVLLVFLFLLSNAASESTYVGNKPSESIITKTVYPVPGWEKQVSVTGTTKVKTIKEPQGTLNEKATESSEGTVEKQATGSEPKTLSGIRVCAGSSTGFTECIVSKEIEIDPNTGERVMEAVPAPAPIEVELNIEGKKEKIKITKSGSKEIEVEDSEGKKFKTSEPIKVSESGLRVKEKPVKVLPGTAIKTVKKSLKSINLKEVELKVIQETPVYEVRAVQKATFLWFIPVEMKVKATVNAQTNSIESIEKPWWSFLVG